MCKSVIVEKGKQDAVHVRQWYNSGIKHEMYDVGF